MMMFSSGTKVEPSGGIDDDFSAGQTFADIIVRVAFQTKVMPFGMNAPKLWPR